MASALEAGEGEGASAPGRASPAFSLSELLGLLRRRRLLVAVCAGLCLLLALAFLSVQTPVYRATAELLVDPQALQVVGKDIVRTDTSASIDFANVDSQALVMTSTGVLKQVIDELNLETDPAFNRSAGLLTRLLGKLAEPTPEQRLAQTIDALKRAIVIQRVDNSLVFRIIVTHPQAQRAADIANTLAQIYFKQGIDGRRAVVERANATLISQIAGLRTQLDEAERAAQTFRAQNNLVSTGEGLVISQQLRDLYSQIGQAEGEFARQQARRDQLLRYGNGSPLSDQLPDALTSPAMAALRTQYAQTAREAASLGQTLAPQHPRLVEIRGELAETRRLLASELSRVRSSIQENYRQAEANLANLRKRAQELTRTQETSSAAQIRLRQLESEAEAVRAVYSASLQRAKELEQQKRIETNNSRMLSEAVAPSVASKVPAALVLAAAALFGSCAGLGIAYLLEWMPPMAGFLPKWRRAPRPAKSEEPAKAAKPEKPAKAAKPAVPEPPPLLTPEAAAEAIGISTVISLPKDSAKRQDALVPVTRLLQRTLGKQLPALVMVAGPADAVTQTALAEGIANSLAAHGESVLICRDSAGGRNMDIQRIEPQGGTSAKPGQRRNFIVMRHSKPTEGKSGAHLPDAIVLAAPLAGQTTDSLIDQAAAVDPTGKHILALVVPQAAAATAAKPKSFAARWLRWPARAAA
ncbi:GumC family protein [uncultured Bosea sp.]|uniref:GumC family protein n=1 Tax=uncultured Bosea sp. TaxID=211457 RepID=UPI0025FE790F|nr:GumC family protein [uncultured Bosea sp.]